MELQTNHAAIISVGVGSWYPHGIDRLTKSLNYHGYWGDTFVWQDEYPTKTMSHDDDPYAFKLGAFDFAFERDKTHVLYVDSSFWAIRPVMEIFDFMNDKGVFAFRTGYSAGQTCTDKLLNWAGITRDDAMEIPEFAGGAIGFNMHNPHAQTVYATWKRMMNAGLFRNSRSWDPIDSTDPRFMHARQDQSAFSLALHMAGVVPAQTDFIQYYREKDIPKPTIFFIGGL